MGGFGNRKGTNEDEAQETTWEVNMIKLYDISLWKYPNSHYL